MQNSQSIIKIHPATLLLGFSIFATGATGLVFEYILGTVATYILGNAIEQLSITFGVMMLFMGIGNWFQKYFSNSGLINKFIYVEIYLAIIGSFAPLAIYAAYSYLLYNFMIVQYGFICIIGFLVGLEIPIVLRINEKYSETLGINLSRIISLDYVGAFIGTLLWTFYLLKTFEITVISFFVGGTNLFIAIITFSYFLKKGLVKNKIFPIIAILISVIVLGMGIVKHSSWNIHIEQHLYKYRIILSETTKYQRLVLTHNPENDQYKFYINGHLQFCSTDEHIYHEMLVHPVMHMVESPNRVLILGGGDGLALREVLKYREVGRISLVDIDPGMINLCASHEKIAEMNNHAFHGTRVFHSLDDYRENQFGTSSTRQFDVVTVDAENYVFETADTWDAIIIDFPDPHSIELAKLYSKEFYQRLRFLLSEDGMISIQSTSPYHAAETFLCIQRTLESAGFETLPFHENIPSFGDWGWIIAKPGNNSPQFQERLARFPDEFRIETKFITTDLFRSSLVFGKDWLVTENTAINTLMKPVILRYYLDESWKYN